MYSFKIIKSIVNNKSYYSFDTHHIQAYPLLESGKNLDRTPSLRFQPNS